MNNKKNFAYAFYRRLRNGEDQYIGFLTERRKKPERITCASIMDYAKKFAVMELFEDRVYFVRLEIESENVYNLMMPIDKVESEMTPLYASQ